MSKGNIFISVIALLVLAPLCQAADLGRRGDIQERPAKRARISAPNVNRGIKSLNSMAAEVCAQQIKQKTLTQNQVVEEGVEEAPLYLKSIAKEYYFLVNEQLDQLPEWLRDSFEGVTLRELHERNRVPAIEIYFNQRLLDLHNKNLVSLEGGFNELPQALILNTNQLNGLPADLDLTGVTFLDLVNNPLITAEVRQQIKNRFPEIKTICF